MDLGLRGKIAIVTGGSRGLGLAAAQALMPKERNVLVCARGEDALKQATRALQKSAASGRAPQ
jgi:NAD(P)-dependent dehydrogenase (short-subunit alcohol dehydrogenase family)